MTQTIKIRQPDDFHVHLRDGDALKLTVKHAAAQFNRITVMPNLQPPVVNTDEALAYLARIQSHIPQNSTLTPLVTLYLTDQLTTDEITKAHAAGVKAIKMYPHGVTTNSEHGVRDSDGLDSLFACMAELGMLLLVHGESAKPDIDIFHREATFIQETLIGILQRHPKLRVVMEHITTEKAVQFVSQASAQLAATITPQHLLANRNHLLSGGIKPHYYCLPILKKESDRRALLQAATSGNPKFFLGTDSAPHTTETKESACGCAGCYTMPYAIEYYAEVFDSVGKIAQLEGFSSRFGAEFYHLPVNTNYIVLEKTPQAIAQHFAYLDSAITPLMAGQSLHWTKR
ncbi:dihydroorotase [Ostreibacterium oceani]|uniref:Dihydroorotase n=1 Tax=Ostreibacterium oceani TaxID=2654998 RepID=A0A6N7EYD7_9GAMM|nr:dihydroorotase [Ostreibacterium oceani]MPV86963.1 dihydroorotase [Ostreibacterium oceani]